ncbi:hypothetical protein [Hydrogenophilus islandicus]
MPHHDSGYKLLFAHPEMVRDLLLEFVPGNWQSLIDFSTLERINAMNSSPNPTAGWRCGSWSTSGSSTRS